MKSMEDNPAGITKADIIVGIPSYNEASLISFPTQQADKGLTKYFGDFSAAIINCDNHSPDDTRRAFMETPTSTPKIYISTEEGVLGKGNNVRNLFGKAVELSARAVVVIDADLKSVTPLWIRNLAEPLLEDYQFVAPLYVRHKYDGFITNNIAYPLTRLCTDAAFVSPSEETTAFPASWRRVSQNRKPGTKKCRNTEWIYGCPRWR